MGSALDAPPPSGEFIERVYREITEILKIEREIQECQDNESAVRSYEILIIKGLTRLRQRRNPPEYIDGLEPSKDTMVYRGDMTMAQELLDKFRKVPQSELNFDTVPGPNWVPVTSVRIGRGGKVSRASDSALEHVRQAKNNDSYGIRRKELADIWAQIRMCLADDIDFFANFNDNEPTNLDIDRKYFGEKHGR